jgi:hypothetical protein
MRQPAPFVCLLFFALLLGSASAHSRELHVTLLLGTGNDPVTYTIPENQVPEFWTRWNYLQRTDQMVPLGQPSSYRGLKLRDSDNGTDLTVSLFNGIGTQEGSRRESRMDAGRLLERWVLAKAPPPLGPVLLRALEQEMAKAPGGSSIIEPAKTQLAGARITHDCRQRAHGNLQLRASCLEENLQKQLGTEAYITLLEQTAGTLVATPPSH